MNNPLPTSANEMTDILDLQGIITLKWLHTLKIVSLILLSLLVLALLAWLFYKLYKKYFYAQDLSPDQKALSDLSELKKKKWIEASHWRAFYFSLDEIFRTYLQTQFGLEILDKTFEELHHDWDRLKPLFLLAEQARLDPFLLRAQLIKFAGSSTTPDDAGEDFAFVERFVRRTKIQ